MSAENCKEDGTICGGIATPIYNLRVDELYI